MSFQEMPPELLRLAPRLSISSSPVGGNLANINTTLLGDGALCWVSDQGVDFRFVRNSTAVADGVNIIAPAAGGPGRWFRGDGGFAPDFAWAKGGVPPQVGVGANVNLIMDQNGLMRGITRPGGSQTVWQLTVGKIYTLLASGHFEDFSDAVAGLLQIDWVDDNNARLQSGAPGPDASTGSFRPNTNTGAHSTSAVVGPFTYQAGAGALSRVKLRCTGATGTATIPASAWCASLIEI